MEGLEQEEVDVKPVLISLQVEKEPPAKKPKKPEVRRGLYCSVNDCHNATKDKFGNPSGFRFFRFPLRNQEQREKWIFALNRRDKDGNPWKPGNSARVCSVHFISGEYSKSRLDPDYVPTIFPGMNKREIQRRKVAKDRYKRMIERKFVKIKQEPLEPQQELVLQTVTDVSA